MPKLYYLSSFHKRQSFDKFFFVQKLKSELINHEPLVRSCIDEGQTLINQNHFASGEIRESFEQLLESWKELLGLGGKRERNIEMNFRVQQVCDTINITFGCTLKDLNGGFILGKLEWLKALSHH